VSSIPAIELEEPADLNDLHATHSVLDVWRDDPASFALEGFDSDPWGKPVTLDLAEHKILSYVGAYDRVAVRTCRGIGKTAKAAILTLWWLSTRSPARVVTSAGVWDHLEEKLWPEIHIWAAKWKFRHLFSLKNMSIHHKIEPNLVRAVATSSNRAENVEGHHSPNTLLIIDEAKALPDELWEALLGTQPDKIVVLSTPPLVDAGWYCARFKGAKGWHTAHVDALDSDRVKSSWVEEMAETFGVDSPIYVAQVLGLIPEGGTHALVPKPWLERAMVRPVKEDFKPRIGTCDVARYGEDLSTFGDIHRAKFSVLEWGNGWSIPKTARMCADLALKLGWEFLCIDDGGVGGGVTDILREEQAAGKFPSKCAIIAENFGARALQPLRFQIRKDELWWHGREALRLDEIAMPTSGELAALKFPRGTDFIEQITSPVYDDANAGGRIGITDKRPEGNLTGWKREFYAHLPTKSPDLAHAYILGADLWRRLRPEPPKDDIPEHGPAYAAQLRAQRREDLRAKVESWKKKGEPPSGNARRRMMR
jgi:hypothetical protein